MDRSIQTATASSAQWEGHDLVITGAPGQPGWGLRPFIGVKARALPTLLGMCAAVFTCLEQKVFQKFPPEMRDQLG